MLMIDAHVHLWQKQQGRVDGKAVLGLSGGRSDFGGEIRQMMPPYLLDGANTAELLLSNMDYAGVSGCVVTQEEIDGNQDAYLLRVTEYHKPRIKVCSLYEEHMPWTLEGFDGIKLCAGRFAQQDLTQHFSVFSAAEQAGKFISIDLADGGRQTAALREIIQQLPRLRIAIGHFGMVTREGWEEQIKLARAENVRIESGGITWLFHHEFYPYPSAITAIQTAAELCGMEKLMWGSDYPRTMTEITYKMSFDFVQKSSALSEPEKALFLGETAALFYGFPPLPEPEFVAHML